MNRDTQSTIVLATADERVEADTSGSLSVRQEGSLRGCGGNRRRPYVLVHGAWFGGWVWKSVAEGLRALGHAVYAPSLTGLGDRKHLLRPGIDLDTHVNDIVNLIEMEDLTDVVLVGWSYGGMVITDVLARLTERVGSMVYIDAYAPARGRSAASYSTRHTTESMLQLVAQKRDVPPLPMESMGVTDQALIASVSHKLTAQPALTFLQDSKALEVWPDIPRTYVLAGAYAKAVTASTFRPFYDAFMLEPRATCHVLEAGHVMMLTDPQATLEVLAKVS